MKIVSNLSPNFEELCNAQQAHSFLNNCYSKVMFLFYEMTTNVLGPIYLSGFNCLINETVRCFFWPKGTVKKITE